MHLTLELVFLCVLLVGTQGSPKQRKCQATNGKHYGQEDQRQGRWKCKRCELCPPGREWNFNATISRSDEHGDTECYPCVPCQVGHYKDTDTLRSCSPCLLKCSVLNRYQDVQCGGVRRGHCGSCLPGFEDSNGHSELPCTPSKGKTESLDRSEHTIHTSVKSPKQPGMSTDLKDILVIAVCCIMIAVAGGLLIFLVKMYLTRRPPRTSRAPPTGAECASSSARLFQSNDSMMYTVANNNDPNIEIDGVLVIDEVRAELQSVSLANAEAERTLNRIMQYPTVRLSKDDHLVSVISMHVAVEHSLHLFSLLNVSSQTVDAEKARYEKGIIQFKEYVLNVLIKWICREERGGATLLVLCRALAQAHCFEALNEVTKEMEISYGQGQYSNIYPSLINHN